MHSAVKMIVGIIIFLIGVYWYLPANWLKQFVPITVGSTFQAFLVVFFGLFGLALIFIGIVVAWIEIEDMKWERREKAEQAKPVAEKEKAGKKK